MPDSCVRRALEKSHLCLIELHGNWNCAVTFPFEEENKLQLKCVLLKKKWQNLIPITYLKERGVSLK